LKKEFFSDLLSDNIFLGFDFNYNTNHFTTSAGKEYTLCYDHGYLIVEDDKVLIINKQR